MQPLFTRKYTSIQKLQIIHPSINQGLLQTELLKVQHRQVPPQQVYQLFTSLKRRSDLQPPGQTLLIWP